VPETPHLPAAVLWDLDGTLVDTEPAWIEAEHRLAAEHGVEWTEEDGEAMVGSALPRAAAIMQERGVDLPADQIIDRLERGVFEIIGAHVPWQPGALELLTELRDEGVKCALVTMSFRAMADRIVAGAPTGVFAAVVAGDEVTHGKPHPEPYLRAAELLRVDIRRCVAIEDSPTGLAAAEASGARVVAIQRVVPVPPRPMRNRLATLEGLGVAGLSRIAAGELIDQLGAVSPTP
jgi:HAD superfamily hydrolase (TIGR01509 family)